MVKKITQQPTGLKWVPVITLSSLCAFYVSLLSQRTDTSIAQIAFFQF